MFVQPRADMIDGRGPAARVRRGGRAAHRRRARARPRRADRLSIRRSRAGRGSSSDRDGAGDLGSAPARGRVRASERAVRSNDARLRALGRRRAASTSTCRCGCRTGSTPTRRRGTCRSSRSATRTSISVCAAYSAPGPTTSRSSASLRDKPRRVASSLGFVPSSTRTFGRCASTAARRSQLEAVNTPSPTSRSGTSAAWVTT